MTDRCLTKWVAETYNPRRRVLAIVEAETEEEALGLAICAAATTNVEPQRIRVRRRSSEGGEAVLALIDCQHEETRFARQGLGLGQVDLELCDACGASRLRSGRDLDEWSRPRIVQALVDAAGAKP